MSDWIDEFKIEPRKEAEASVIGSMLISSGLIPEIMGELSSDEFLIPEYRTICKACYDLHLRGGAVDPVSISGNLVDKQYKALLAQCIQLVPSTKNWRSYVDIVKETYKRHSVVNGAFILMEQAKYQPLEELQKLAIGTVEALNQDSKQNTWDAKQGFTQFMVDLQKQPDYEKTGIQNLDKHLYLESGDFVVIGARPSVGKTAFGVQLMLNMAKTHRVGFFSLETNFKKIFGRAIGNYTSTSQDVIKNHDEQLNTTHIASFYQNFAGLDLYVIECAGWTTSQIQAKAVQLELDIAIVDYLQKVKSVGNGRYEKVTNISQDLADMARTRKITTFALAQLNREGRDVPSMEDLRESGQIEQDADAILLLHSVGENREPARKLYIAKNKEGITGELNFVFDGQLQKFQELESRYENN